MAMKFVKSFCSELAKRRTAGACCFLAVLLGLAGCGGTSVKDPLVSAEVVPVVLPTESYLPVDSFDKEGVLLPYEVAANPYAVQTGRIKKETVAQFIAARRAFRAESYGEAKQILEKLVDKARELSGPKVMLGDIALQEQRLDDAATLYEQAITTNPENVNAYLRLAKVRRLQGQFVVAQNYYAQALALWKDFPEAHLNLAILYDVYMNKPLLAQQHMEAYQFLSGNREGEVATWLAEIRERTGVDYSIRAGKPAHSVSVAGDGV
ncbi:tetratricopeptide repeat protein [Teredinibacter turnerae]|uniref:tetratricopeptide repeat protein n=1 Tax=Teredinibacter turnerae TaxID=2426 RepID=UPI000374A92E|nr:tetratricopeptide repeat protein [Teredinibacter turnerae]